MGNEELDMVETRDLIAALKRRSDAYTIILAVDRTVDGGKTTLFVSGFHHASAHFRLLDEFLRSSAKKEMGLP